MCSCAIFWGGVRRVVFALSSAELGGLTGGRGLSLAMSCRDVFARGSVPTEVEGPQ